MWIIAFFAGIVVIMILAFCVTADAIERRWERLDEWRHPPDSEVKLDDEDPR